MQHKRGYFEGQLQQKLILGIKTVTGQSYKNIASALGISERTLYYLKSGEKIAGRDVRAKFKTFMQQIPNVKKAKIGILAEHYKRTGKTKPLKKEEGEKILKRHKEKIDNIIIKLHKSTPEMVYKEIWY